MLAVRYPCCVIVIPQPGLGASFQGHFTDCLFFYDEQQSLPVTFMCAAWSQCMWLYEGVDDSLRRNVEVAEDGKETFTVTITDCQDMNEGSRLKEESTGYIFSLDVNGELRSFVHNLH